MKTNEPSVSFVVTVIMGAAVLCIAIVGTLASHEAERMKTVDYWMRRIEIWTTADDGFRLRDRESARPYRYRTIEEARVAKTNAALENLANHLRELKPVKVE